MVTNRLYAAILALVAISWPHHGHGVEASSSWSDVTFVDNGYENVVVSISDRLDRAQCPVIVRNLWRLFTEMSEELYLATRGLATIRSVVVVLPPTWEAAQCNLDLGQVSQTSDPDAEVDAAFKVEPPAPGIGSSTYASSTSVHALPWTVQHRGCGQGGRHVRVPVEFLVNFNATANKFGKIGTIMVREWAKYRYGVFEENGYPGDPLYPSFYKSYRTASEGWTTGEEETKPTSCTNHPVEGETICADKDNCVFKPMDVPANHQIKSSIMYANKLRSVDQFCDSETHDQMAPTKHNVLCGGRSTWDVIKAHPDFQGAIPLVEMPPRTPIFSYKKRSPRRVVFCMDWTRSMSNNSRWEDVRGATYRILELLAMEGRVAAGSSSSATGDATRIAARSASVGLVQFNSDADKDRAPQAVNRMPISSGSLISRYPSGDDTRCVTCGIRRAVQLLEQDTQPSAIAGSEIIIVAQERGIGNQLDSVERDLLRKRIRVHAIVYPESSYAEIQTLARRTGGKVFQLQDRRGAATTPASMMEIVNAYESILQPQGTAKIYQSELRPSGPGTSASDEFQVDSGVKPPLRLTVFYPHRSGPRATQLVSPSGSIFGDFESSSQEYTADTITVLQDPLQKGTWSFKVDLVSQSPIVVEIRGQTASDGKDTIAMSTWTSWDERQTVSMRGGSAHAPVSGSNPRPENLPLVIYADLTKGGLPVVDAKVYALVRRRVGGGIGLSGQNDTVTVPLFDDGMGDPDIRKGDAIYSGHFSQFLPGDAIYSVSVVANDNDNEAKYIAPNEGRRARRFSFTAPNSEDAMDFQYCCGGSRPVDPPLVATGQFQRMAEGREFKLNAGPKDDIYPPNRVTDLKATAWPEYDRITLHWTAPGGDYKQGKATLYEIRFSTDRAVVLDQTRFLSEGQILSTLPDPDPAGAPQEADAFVIKDKLIRGKVYHFALRALDGPWSQLSNVATVALPLPPSAASGSASSTHPGTFDSNDGFFSGGLSLEAWIGIGVACVMFAVLALAVAIYCCLTGKRRQTKTTGGAAVKGGVNPLNGDYIKTPLPTVSGSNGVASNPPNGNSGGSVCLTSLAGSEHSPQYIPASALLDEHERRQSMVRSRTPPRDGRTDPIGYGHYSTAITTGVNGYNNGNYNNSYSFDNDGLSSTQSSDIGGYDAGQSTWMSASGNMYGTLGGSQRGPPPPVAPKPTRVVAVPPHVHQFGGATDLNGSRTSLRSGASTLRNVTQV